jgi:hypothetical protein
MVMSGSEVGAISRANSFRVLTELPINQMPAPRPEPGLSELFPEAA